MTLRTQPALATALLLLAVAPSARAQGQDVARADALFGEAKALKASGRWDEACTRFEESKRAANGVGVTLHLADCHAHVGRSASAWSEFLEAEKLARERSDKRADVAHARATELASKINRLTFALTPAAQRAGVDVRVDGGGTVPRDFWTVGVALDPGRHLIVAQAPGRPARTIDVTIEAARPVTTVTIDDDAPASAVVAPPSPPPRSPAPAVAHEPEVDPEPPADPRDSRTTAEYGLLGIAGFGAAVGGAFLIGRDESMSNSGSPESQRLATIAATTSFAVGGAALVGAIVLYLTDGHRDAPTTGSITPGIAPGGAFLRATF
jgi:hypothetical protein